MDAPRTPDTLSTQAENELICEKLLGFVRGYTATGSGTVVWRKPATETRRVEEWYTPSFTTWADAGLIMDALSSRGQMPRIGERTDGAWYCVLKDGVSIESFTACGAIRAAALEYIKAVKS